MDIAEIDWARLAAFVDGEGSITIGKQKDQRRTGGYRYYITVSVYNTNEKLIDWVVCTFNMSKWGRHDGDPKHKKSFKAYATRYEAEEILHSIKPWLIIKEELADTALELQSTMGKGRGRAHSVSEDDLGFREYLWQKARRLNQKGGTQN